LPNKSSNLRIVLLSGPIGSGKSALVRQLEERYRAKIIKTRELILKKSPRTKSERTALQRAGQRLDGIDGGAWVGEALQRTIETHSSGQTPRGLFVIDAVRIQGQIEAIRKAYGTDVHHIHLTAPEEELERRYEQRNGEGDHTVDYSALKKNRTEREIEKLAEIAV
tara:strand:- start:421 stop:918 length:498 start_codon:yes stop_codon:yes gene_type:complete